jgi:4-carboxymuconolactone decarboxylase
MARGENQMSRIPELQREELDAEGQRLYDEILTARGSTAGPFRVWLHSPEFVRRATQLGEFLRYHTGLLPRLSELVILITARLQESDVEWAIHEPLAPKAGLRDDVIEALRNRGCRPSTRMKSERFRATAPHERRCISSSKPLGKRQPLRSLRCFAAQLRRASPLPKKEPCLISVSSFIVRTPSKKRTFRQLVATLGNKAAVEVTALCGSTPMVAMTLNAFGIGTLVDA